MIVYFFHDIFKKNASFYYMQQEATLLHGSLQDTTRGAFLHKE